MVLGVLVPEITTSDRKNEGLALKRVSRRNSAVDYPDCMSHMVQNLVSYKGDIDYLIL